MDFSMAKEQKQYRTEIIDFCRKHLNDESKEQEEQLLQLDDWFSQYERVCSGRKEETSEE